jgi:putative nucleotidyltransferase with HDIG domain
MSPPININPTPLDRPAAWPALLTALQPLLAAQPSPVYLVGGAVRDALLNRPGHDLDFVTGMDGQQVARAVANAFDGDYYALDPERGIGRAILIYDGQRYEVDVSRFRGADLADDLIGRDFTINAIAMPMHAANADLMQVIDPLNGRADLKLKRIRRCSPTSISDDPIRALRAVRLANALKMQIEPETRADIKANAARLHDTSIERIRDEFMKILDSATPHAALRALDALGYLRLIVPEVEALKGVTQRPPHIYDVWEHTLKVVEAMDVILRVISPERTDETAADGIYGMVVYRLDRYRPHLQAHLATEWPNGRTQRALLIFGALYHDIAKPQTRTIGEDGIAHFYEHEKIGAPIAYERAMELRLSSDEAERVRDMVRYHMRPANLGISEVNKISARSLYRYWNAAGIAGVDVALLTQADYLGVHGHTTQLQPWLAHLEIVAQLLEAYYFQREKAVRPPPLVDGNDLMQALAIPPGPMIGHLLRRISEAQATGEITTREDAFMFAHRELAAPTPDAPND